MSARSGLIHTALYCVGLLTAETVSIPDYCLRAASARNFGAWGRGCISSAVVGTFEPTTVANDRPQAFFACLRESTHHTFPSGAPYAMQMKPPSLRADW